MQNERLLLHWAALNGRETLVKLILDSDAADIDLIDATDDTDVSWMVESESLKLQDYLML